MSVTLILIAVTVIVSVIAFRKKSLMDDLIFYAPAISERKQYYRFISCGFIHADFMHLIFNMYAFYMFGETMEMIFSGVFGAMGKTIYLLLYLTSLVACLLPYYYKDVHNTASASLGASGAVSAVVFAYILFDPLRGIGIIFIPGVYMSGFLVGIIYLLISYWLDKKGTSRINHSAHIWGAVYGMIFFMVATELFSKYPLLENFGKAIQGLDVRDIITFS